MYEAFYGFKEKPFSMLPDPGFLYLSKKHQAALTLLEYGLLNHVGFCVISGDAGAGKTTILRALLERLEDDVKVGLITNTHQSFGGLLDWVLSAFDLHRANLTHVEMHQIFMEYLIEEYASGRTVLLIVDEAQNMKPDALEELRMLSNVNSEKDQLMQVVLAGQPALKETLRLPDLMQFAQRIAVDYHLDPLSLEETCGYIQHRLKVAGAQKDAFTPAACERIHNYSGGTPRLINLLCETVLVYGFADQQEIIDVDLVDEMVLERMKDSVVPIVNRDIAKKDNAKASKALEKDFPHIHPDSDDVDSAQKKESVVTDPVVDEQQPAVAETVAEGIAETQENAEVTGSEEENHRHVKNEQSIEDEPPLPATENRVAAIEAFFVDDENRKQLIKFAGIAAIVVVLLIIFALVPDDDEVTTADVADEEIEVDVETGRQQEQEEKQLRQLQIQAETLKKERDAAIAKAEKEREAKLQAEKQAAAKAAIAAKAAAEKLRLQEKKRLDAAKKRERKAKQAEAKAKEETERIKRESAKLEEQRRVMDIRLEEERRLKEVEEARRLELEYQEAQRKAVEEAEAKAAKAIEEAAAAEAAEKEKFKTSECSGPTARFKAGCR